MTDFKNVTEDKITVYLKETLFVTPNVSVPRSVTLSPGTLLGSEGQKSSWSTFSSSPPSLSGTSVVVKSGVDVLVSLLLNLGRGDLVRTRSSLSPT